MTDPGKLAADLLQKYFPKFGSFRRSCIYQVTDNGYYNTDTREAEYPVLSEHPFEAIFDQPTGSLLGAIGVSPDDPLIKDMKSVVFPALDLPVEPTVNDLIVREDSRRFIVWGIAPDPKPAHYSLVVVPFHKATVLTMIGADMNKTFHDIY